MKNTITVFVLVFVPIKCQDISSFIDIDALSELPLESLLNVKKNLLSFKDNQNETVIEERIDKNVKGQSPEALPLQSYQNLKNQGGYFVQYDDDSKKDHKKKNISTIFQLSVTTLAFLAFGGYLLYLVVAAIKGKNYNYMYDPNSTQIMSAMINAQLNRRNKRKRIPIRNGGGFNGYRQKFANNRNRNKVRPKRGAVMDMDPEMMYQALVHLSEGYTKFFGLDYGRSNYSSFSVF